MNVSDLIERLQLLSPHRLVYIVDRERNGFPIDTVDTRFEDDVADFVVCFSKEEDYD